MNVNQKVAYKVSGVYKGKGFSRAFISHIKKWMLANDVKKVEIEGKTVSAVEHIENVDRDIHIRLWLDGDLTTEQLLEHFETEFWLVEYDLKTFVEMIRNDED